MRLVVSGTARTGKFSVIECLQKLVRKAFGTNDVIQVITLTGNAAYFVGGCTAHSFLGIPTGGRSCNELSAPSGPLLDKNSEEVRELKSFGG